VISVEDIAWVRFRAPDLDLMESFLADFGLVRAARTADRLYMRACGAEPFVHVTERGPVGDIGFALRAQSLADLRALADSLGTSVQARTEPGGGHVVNLVDPDGNQVEVVHGFSGERLPGRSPFDVNPSEQRKRFNGTVRSRPTPSKVQRLGHVALYTDRFAAMSDFYMRVLGMRISDSYHAGSPDNVLAHFLHCGLKDRFVDHHTVALIGIGRTGFEHCAFEVTDLDDLMSGNEYLLAQKRWKHSWGIGRHVEGSQIFDYWRDPFGNKIEHWTDGDLVNDDYKSGSAEFNPQTSMLQWGPALTPDFME
jgi:catechol 2,3-dioxygenase-like lactoylglutathione lyase family enzyme